MDLRYMWTAAAVALLLALTTAARSSGQDFEVEEQPISLVGCVMPETEYRRLTGAGKGGVLGFGGGLGDEYVLVNAARGATGAAGDCSSMTGGEAFELTGPEEDELEPFVGQRVAITGMLKKAEIDAATGRPTGGREVGYDLRLFEVDVESFRAFAAPVRTDTLTRVEQEQPQFDRNIDQDRQIVEEDQRPTGTSGLQRDGDRDRLPRTASPLALTGLLGLLSIGGIAGLRAMYRRDRRQFR